MKRVESLDYLRGLMALSVMVYHYTSWSFGGIGPQFLLGKLGIYAVSIFYILSGLSLAIVYNGRISALEDVRDFVIKRVFRIFPLFWLAVTGAIILKLLPHLLSNPDAVFPFYKVFLNYTLLFGFVDPGAYLTTGTWSIGNEMVFYVIFPCVFLAAAKVSFLLPLSIIASGLIGLYFAFFAFNSNGLLTEQWVLYINPFNQLFLFMGGVAIGLYGKQLRTYMSQRLWGLVLLLSFVTFTLFPITPTAGDKLQIITGLERVVLSLLCFSFVLSLFLFNPVFRSMPARLLGFFGEGCYSIYLLHPIVATPVVAIGGKLGMDKPVAYVLSFFLTLFVSWLTFNYLEKPMMDRGKWVVGRLNS